MRWSAVVALGCTGTGVAPTPPADTDVPTEIPTDPVVEPDVLAVALVPGRPLVAAGSTVQLRAFAWLEDGTLANASADTAWTGGDPAVAVVDPTGLLTGAAPGTAAFTATVDGVTLQGTARVFRNVCQPIACKCSPECFTSERESVRVRYNKLHSFSSESPRLSLTDHGFIVIRSNDLTPCTNQVLSPESGTAGYL